MTQAAKKRYIVSFVEETAGSKAAAEVLGVAKKKVRDGLSLMATDAIPGKADIMHFEDIGASVVSLSEKEKALLENDDRVAEVQEDFEVHALGKRDGCNGADGGEGIFEGEEDLEAAHQEAYDPFLAGYQQAMTDFVNGMQGGVSPADPPVSSGLPFPRQTTQRWFFPPWLFRCPPGYRRVGTRCVRVDELPLQPIPWNISMIKADQVWRRVTGQGVKVAIIDTGIDDNHPDLSVSGGVSFVPGRVSWDDDQGHGTHCAGIAGARNNSAGVVGVAPNCALYAVKVLNQKGSGQLSWILAGMNWAARNGMDVASMSLGSEASSSNARCVLAYQRAAQTLINQKCIVVAAAGNSGSGQRPWVGQPARCPGFVAVAAVDQSKRLSSFSSRGPESLCAECGVEIAAPGSSINSTIPGGGYRRMSGTSMACPHVAGAAALLKEQHPSWSPAQIRQRLKATASDLGAPGDDPGFGAGLLNCHRAVFG